MPTTTARAMLYCIALVVLCAGCGNPAQPANSAPANTAPANTPTPATPPAGLTYSADSHNWKQGDPTVKMIGQSEGFCFLSGMGGHFQGQGEEVRVAQAESGEWTLSGTSKQFGVAAEAVSVKNLQPQLFRPRVQEYSWKLGDPPVRMLHRNQGVCCLSAVSGNFEGGGEGVRVRLADDGYWYLEGHSQQGELYARAIGLEWVNPNSVEIDVREREWSAGDSPVRLLAKQEGLCFLGAVSGNFEGDGEMIRIDLKSDGYWHLSGISGQPDLKAWALVVRIPSK